MRDMTITGLAPSKPQTPLGVTYAIGVIRVSKVGKRTPDKLRSPEEQMDRINRGLATWCPDEHVEIAQWHKEIDVSGYRLPLSKRKRLLAGVEAIERGEAKILVVAYYNRLCRNSEVKREVVRRVEAAGGRLLSIDFGLISDATAAQWLSSTIVMDIEEYYSRQLGERLGQTQANSIAAGIPIGSVPPGYTKDETTRRLVVVEPEATVMREAFRLRAKGASWSVVRHHLAKGGIVRSTGSARKLLQSRTYLGELFHGKNKNPNSHQPIIDLDTFERVAGNKKEAYCVPGRKSSLLLSSTRILRCGTCGKALAAASQVQAGKRYPVYRCNPNLVCSRRVAIDARIANEAVASYVRDLLSVESATEGPGLELIKAQGAAADAQAAYGRAMRNLADSADEPEAKAILAQKRAARDNAVELATTLERRARMIGNAVTLNAAADWDTLSPQGQRDLITAVLERVVVAPGSRHFRGAERLTFVRNSGEPLS